ncbi:hypothetical protein KC865_05085 [Candidatus Kaiserbacteria bacterium]|nr:hypothetical protein [Candidatus Kaiserbacteria bacterium]USN92212.1 MAG: hypothetical protein H6782_00050 [Candidatus Nomurabacteria bacterium]
MNSQVVFRNTFSNGGFSLVEIMLVISLMFILGSFVAPIGMSFYHLQLLNETTDGLKNSLRQAQSFALTGKNGQAFGVYVDDNSFILFEGDSYAGRNVSEDVVYGIATAIDINGPSEFVFARLSGEPDVYGDIEISLGNRQRQIQISVSGNIN